MTTTSPHAAEPAPFSDRDKAILDIFLTPDAETADICRDRNLTIAQLHEWVHQPHVQRLIQQLHEVNLQRARLAAVEELPHAVRTLGLLARGLSATRAPANPETQRRAASAIARFAQSPRKPGALTPPPHPLTPPLTGNHPLDCKSTDHWRRNIARAWPSDFLDPLKLIHAAGLSAPPRQRTR